MLRGFQLGFQPSTCLDVCHSIWDVRYVRTNGILAIQVHRSKHTNAGCAWFLSVRSDPNGSKVQERYLIDPTLKLEHPNVNLTSWQLGLKALSSSPARLLAAAAPRGSPQSARGGKPGSSVRSSPVPTFMAGRHRFELAGRPQHICCGSAGSVEGSPAPG